MPTRREVLISVLGLTALRLGAQERARLDSLLSLFDFQAEAQKNISHGAWERIMGASADEITMRWNHEAYEHIRLKPRILVDVSKVDTHVKLFGEELPFSIVLAPTGAQSFVYPEGDLASVRGAGAAKATLCISSSASLKIEEVAKAATGPVWFQLYVLRGRGFTRELVQRAESAGCRALCVTVDSAILENHGVVTAGGSLREAFRRFETLEFTAKTIIKARLLGEVRHLSEPQIALARAGDRCPCLSLNGRHPPAPKRNCAT